MERGRRNDSPRIAASPRARRAMRNRGIDPRSVRGSGPGGRITEADVEQAVGPQQGVTTESSALGESSRDRHALTPMRRSIARIAAASTATVPQFRLRAELDAAPLLALREQLLMRAGSAAIASETQVRLSITDLVLRAMGLALCDNPAANAIWVDGTIRRLSEINVGLVVNLDDGLLVPTLGGVASLTLAQLARQRSEVVAAARRERLDAAGFAATSLSNLGTTRVDDFAAVVFPPQSTILAAGRIVDRPFVVDGKLKATPTLRLTLSVDHRVLDGAPAAQFLGRIVHYLEQPAMMVHAQSRP
jgi:pyruvate dehydrogenase E2 component (dihydrolipoamide acetyltransferase)